MLEMVEDRKDADKVEERYDLFSGLLDAAQDEPGSEAALSDDELIGWSSMLYHSTFIEVVLPPLLGNMFIFLLAGHEVGSFPFSSRVVPIRFLRLQRIHYASHLPCWLCILPNKSVYINT
jgi:hypothetical protein